MKKVLSALILVLIPLFGFATEFKAVCAARVSLNFSPCFAYKTTPNGNNSTFLYGFFTLLHVELH